MASNIATEKGPAVYIGTDCGGTTVSSARPSSSSPLPSFLHPPLHHLSSACLPCFGSISPCPFIQSKFGGVWADGTPISMELRQASTNSQKGKAVVVEGWVRGVEEFLEANNLRWDQVSPHSSVVPYSPNSTNCIHPINSINPLHLTISTTTSLPSDCYEPIHLPYSPYQSGAWCGSGYSWSFSKLRRHGSPSNPTSPTNLLTNPTTNSGEDRKPPG
jgi:hypothetical protein